MAGFGILPWVYEGAKGVSRTFRGNPAKERELERRGFDAPWWQKALYQSIGGVGLGSYLHEQSLERKLGRTEDAIPTRGAVGLEGDAAMQATARFYQQQLARQLGTEIGNINVQFGGAGRYTSGQRGRYIDEAQERASAGFGDFLSRTALQRYLTEQQLQTQADIAQMQMEGQAGAGRTQLFGQGVFSLANIFAQNPQYLEWLWNKGGNLFGGNQPLGPAY